MRWLVFPHRMVGSTGRMVQVKGGHQNVATAYQTRCQIKQHSISHAITLIMTVSLLKQHLLLSSIGVKTNPPHR
jgi:hypothetical protein